MNLKNIFSRCDSFSKVPKTSARGSFENEAVINIISAVGSQCQTICDKEQPHAYFLVGLVVPEIKGNYLHQNEKHIDVDRSRNIKKQSSPEYERNSPVELFRGTS